MKTPAQANSDEEETILPVDPADLPLEPQPSPQQLREVERQEKPNEKFTIVGLGGSAGSVGALEKFFQHMPPAVALPSWWCCT
ncbi:hypothetical protein [Hymenobacter cellulosilyticus]|uniref:Uncharacterized protein n=1 Tax=Hymenobacter cellulosilyticus TaxID=2932248 RepID=A0A8T9Q1M3_9BACT|nr:hypothetical protein [Hymenobacter cellulosilyticus]UOQ71307.1 hypothetical protein MUN79_22140 [Hymenobacter cellulosilyticus]